MGRRGAAAVVVTVTEIDDVIVVMDEVEDELVRLVVVLVDARMVGVGTTTSVSTITPVYEISFYLILKPDASYRDTHSLHLDTCTQVCSIRHLGCSGTR